MLPAFTQETDIDTLFKAPPDDIVSPEEPKTIDHRDSFEKSEKLLFSGNIEAVGGAVLGWTEPPDSPRFASSWDATPYAEATAYLNFDARPDRSFHLHGSLLMSTAPDSGNYAWTGPSVEELYSDYVPSDAVILRFGTFTTTWGQGRLYTPGDLMDNSEEGLSLRINFPMLLSGVSLIALAQSSFFADTDSPSYTEIEYGALVDQVIGPVRVSAGARYRKMGNDDPVLSKGLYLLGSVKTTAFGTDLLCDFVYGSTEAVPIALFGFFRDWDSVKVYGEYESDGKVGLALAVTRIFNTSVDFGIKWLHTLSTESGAVAAGISFSPFTHLRVQAALPFQYGDGANDIFDSDYPVTQRIGLVLLLRISTPF